MVYIDTQLHDGKATLFAKTPFRDNDTLSRNSSDVISLHDGKAALPAKTHLPDNDMFSGNSSDVISLHDGKAALPAKTDLPDNDMFSGNSSDVISLHDGKAALPAKTHLPDNDMFSGNSSNVISLYKVYHDGFDGRFGNLLFQYAAAYGIARMNNRSAVVHKTRFNSLWEVFANLTIPRDNPKKMTTLREAKYGTYDRKFERLPDSNVLIHGYFQSWKYFQRYESDLRKQFVFKESVLSEARDYLMDIARTYTVKSTAENITFVGVHVRRGDRVTSIRADTKCPANRTSSRR